MKKLLIVVGAVILVLVLAAVLAPFLVSADAFKGQILAQVRDATGRQLRIDGPLSLGFFPNVKVEATDVSLANAPGAASPSMATLKKLDLVVRLMPLLSGRIEVVRLALIEPRINLEIDAQGRPSWSFAGSGAPLPAPAPGTVPSTNATMMALADLSRASVNDMSIENGDIVFLDRRTNQHYELRQVTLTVSAPSLAAPATVDGAAMWRGKKVTFSATLDSTGALVVSGGKTNLTASLTADPITLKFTGRVANAASGGFTGLTFDGNTDLAVPSVRDLVAWSGMPITLPRHGFGALSVSGTVHAANGGAQFSRGKFALDTIKATGAVTLDGTGARPSIAGTLATGMLDFNPYLGPAKPGWSTDTFDDTVLRQVDAELTVNADGATYRRMQIGKSAATVHLTAGKLALDVANVALYHGTGKGSIDLDATGDTAAVTVNGSISGVDIGPLMRDAGGGAGIGGSGSFTIAATAHGNSERDLIGTLTGRASFRVANGAIGGVDLGGMLKNSSLSFGGGGATAIERASGNFTIRNGIMSNSDLSVTAASIDATGAGTVNLPARSLNYRIEPKLIAGIVTVPVIVSGPWEHPSFTPDVAGIAKGLVTAPVNVVGGAAGSVGKVGQGVGEGVGGVAKGVGGALKSLFGN